MFAVVLSRRDFREYDQLVSFYTKDQGKVEALARGVKKSTSKNGAALEPFCFVDVEVIPGKEVNHIGKVQLLEMFPIVRSDIRKVAVASYVVSFADVVVSGKEKDESLFNVLVSLMEALNGPLAVTRLMVPAAILKIMSLLGFTPVLDRCVQCGSERTEATSFWFDALGGGLVCSRCREHTTFMAGQRIHIGAGVLEVVGKLLAAPWAHIASMTPTQGEIIKVEDLVYRFASFHTSQKIADWRRMWISMFDTLKRTE